MSASTLHIYEQKSQLVRLSPIEVEALRQYCAKEIEVIPTYEPEIYQIKAGSHVGFVVLPSGRNLIIEPKAPIDTLFALLAAVYEPQCELFTQQLQGYTSVQALFEFVVSVFVTQVEDLITKGILRGYRQQKDELSVLRGRLLLIESIRHRPGLQDRHACIFSQFTADVPENRILRLTAHYLGHTHFQDRNLPARLHRIGQVLKDATLDSQAYLLFERIQFHRMNEPYQPALALARLLLDHLSFSGTEGKHVFLSYLIDMAWLFERYLGVVLRRHIHQWGLRLVEQDAHTLDIRSQIRLRPDIVIYQDHSPSLIVDAKYKLNEDFHDLYQMLAYCHATGISQAVLVHPAWDHAPQKRVSYRGWGDVCTHYTSLDLRGTPENLAESGRNLAQQLYGLVRNDIVV